MPSSGPFAVKVSMRTKVLVPMVTVMVLLLGLTVWTVNRAITRQFQTEATRSLSTAEAVFDHSLKLHQRNLLLRYHNLPNEPRYKAVLQAGDPPTLRALLTDLLAEQEVSFIRYTALKAELSAGAQRDPLLATGDLVTNSLPAVTRALAGEQKVDTIRVGDRLFDIVSLPVFGSGDSLIGALTFGSEIGNAEVQELSELTRGRLVLLAGGRVLASSLPGPQLQGQLAQLFEKGSPVATASGELQAVLLDGEHYYYSAGKFACLNPTSQLGYLLLISFEQSLGALHHVQQVLLGVSAAAILLGSVIVWFLVRQATLPLRALRDSAEAVGRGDFSRRVEVSVHDECGELAAVFNQMTEKLKRSHQELEQTVETLKTTQAQLVQSEKLSGIGEFVAGVAHELNNPLTTVMGFSELLAQADAEPQHRRFLEMIHKSAQRCQKIVQSLLSFARRHAPERKPADLNALITGAVEFLQYQLRTSNIEVVTHLDPQLPQTLVDPHQVQQVFLNIINNARQAIEGHRRDGRIVVSTARQGDRLKVVLQDNGPGIAEENLSKLFNPFFTTKEVGKGTGLGLSICYGIIKEHGGTITVQSRFGEGATFIIELPLVSPTASSGPSTEAANASISNSQEGAGKRVLVIDDEELIVEMIREGLLQNGYQVDTAPDGQSALEHLGRTRYDLILCDWKMPGLNGEQVYRRLHATDPELAQRIIFMTGDVISDQFQEFLRQSKNAWLSKPFSLSDFRTAISKGLTSGASATQRDGLAKALAQN